MSDNTEDFSNYPVSLNEKRASDNPQGAALWTPRETLIAALRAIDRGEIKPNHLLVVMATEEDKPEQKTKMDYFNCIPGTFYGVGMYQAAIKDLLENGGQ